MPRTAREKSAVDIYHIMLRGLDRTALFYDDEDKREFMDCLSRYKEKYGFSIFAYSLMQNHVHLLLREGQVSISEVMKGLSLSYSRYFNKRYDRTGYLFQGRFLSEAIDSAEYLLSVMRYIHNNPVEVGEDISYWTSYKEFIGNPEIIDVDEVLTFVSPNAHPLNEKQKRELLTKAPLPARPLGSSKRESIGDVQALEIIRDTTGSSNPLVLQVLDKQARDDYLHMLKQKGLTVRQISRLTGIGRGVVFKAGR